MVLPNMYGPYEETHLMVIGNNFWFITVREPTTDFTIFRMPTFVFRVPPRPPKWAVPDDIQ